MFEFRVAVARRAARLVAGAVLILGAVQLARAALIAKNPLEGALLSHLPHEIGATELIAATWLVALASYAIVRVAVTAWWPRHAQVALTPALDALSLAVPAAGIALMAPLTLHLPVALYVSDGEGFDAWVWLSVVIVGPTHLVFAGLVARRARQLAYGRPAIVWGKIAGISVVVASVPWIVFLFTPTLVGITALVLAPLCRVMDRVAARDGAERAALGYLPIATVVQRGRAAA
jgi:hypothetical protein